MMTIEVTGIHYDVDDSTLKYALKRLGRLEKYLPRHARKSAAMEAKLKQINGDNGNKYEAEVLVRLPGKDVIATDSTVNVLAAIDIVEAKLSSQLRKYKQMAQKAR